MDDPDDALEIELTRTAMVPQVDEEGRPRHFAPFGAHRDPCSVCTSRCCRWTVRASVADVVLFCVALSVPYWAGFRLIRAYDPKAFRLDDPPRYWTGDDARPGDLRAEFVLLRNADGACAHLMDLGGHFRCGVYDARPSACRLYPVSWTSKTRKGAPPMVLCPAPFAVGPQRASDFRRDIARSIRGWEIHEAIHTEWEQADLGLDGRRTEDRLAGFVLSRAADRLGVSVDGVLDGRTGQERMMEAMRFR